MAVEPDLLALFVGEVDGAAPRLQELILALEAGSDDPREGEEAMRIAHSIKGAARIVGLGDLVETLHAAEDVLTAAQRGRTLVRRDPGAAQAGRSARRDHARREHRAAAWLARKHGLLEELVGTLRRPAASIPPPAARCPRASRHDASAGAQVAPTRARCA